MKVTAVVVTYNRLNLLKECIDSIRNQTRKLDEIIIVNNDSKDGTKEWLDKQNDLTVIHQENIGGAGGFHNGIKAAYEKGYDWIWCMDDDAAVEKTSLENLIALIYKKNNKNIGFIACKVIWVDGKPHVMNLPGYFFKQKKWTYIGDEKFTNGFHKIDIASFVGCLFNSKAVSETGFPDKGYFIYFDDLEYTSRFKKFENYYLSNSVIIHKTKVNSAINYFDVDSYDDFKIYYSIRNFTKFYSANNFPYLIFFILKLSLFAVKNFLKGRIKLKQLKKIFLSILQQPNFKN